MLYLCINHKDVAIHINQNVARNKVRLRIEEGKPE